jgi:uncharacterized protein involved in exopolysaccharide biosynthesis
VLLDLKNVLAEIRRQRVLFCWIVAAAWAISVADALLTRPVYRAEAVVAPVSEDALSSASGGLGGQLGGLAALAGGLLGGSAHWKDAVAVLHSRHLIESLVTRENLLPVLFPPHRSWLPWGGGRDARPPTMGDAVLLFQRRILQIREDLKTGLVTVRVEWFDARVAADWANQLVALADAELRGTAVTDAQSSLNALQEEFRKSEDVELRSTIAHLIEAQLRTKVVAGVRSQYAYRLIDRAVPADPDKRVRPMRTLMVLLGTLAGALLGALAVVIRARYLEQGGGGRADG